MMTDRRRMLMTAQGNGGGLPSAYQAVEWIRGGSSQCIDTQFVPTAQTKIEWDAAGDKAGGAEMYEGILQQVNGVWRRVHTQYGATILLYLNETYVASTQYNTNFHKFEINGNKCRIDSGVEFTGSFPNQITIPFHLFRRNRNVGTDSWGGTISRSYFKAWDEDGKLVRAMMACYRKSDGVIGMYDLCRSICPLTGTPFYINAGTGTFTKGADAL